MQKNGFDLFCGVFAIFAIVLVVVCVAMISCGTPIMSLQLLLAAIPLVVFIGAPLAWGIVSLIYKLREVV